MIAKLKPRQRSDYPRDLIEVNDSGLRDKHFQILLAADEHGGNYDMIGAALSLPPGTVRSRLHRARAALAKVLADS